MKITTKEPERPRTKVIIEMTDIEACELRDFLSPDQIHSGDEPVVHEFFEMIHELTESW